MTIPTLAPRKLPLSLVITLALSAPLHAADFTIVSGQTVTTPQTLNDNETGTIKDGGELTTISSAIIAPGNDVTISNNGIIVTVGSDAFGIVSTGNDLTVTNNSNIVTSGGDSYGIVSSGEDAILTNNGNISTSGSSASGILSTDSFAKITNNDSISTTGFSAFGIRSAGSGATISNLGSISTSGAVGKGIFSTGADVTIFNSGSISTTFSDAEAIATSGPNATIINTGSISTAFIGVAGIRSIGNNTNISNSGTITTSGAGSDGINSQGNNHALANSGSISTTDDNAGGIDLDGDGASIVNDGSIATLGDFSRGIIIFGDNNSVTNQGSITTVGRNSEGIYSRSLQSAITNAGTINTTGDFSKGIDSGALDSQVNNTGTITTSGSRSSGITLFGSLDTKDTLLTNSGSILTTGAQSVGIELVNSGTITNSGLISATGTDSFAILGTQFADKDSILNILPGSQIIGRIDLGRDGTDNDTANIYAGGIASNLTLENVENINIFGPATRVGDSVVTVDPTGEGTRGVALAGMTSSIHGVISQRMSQTAPIKPVQVASLELSPGMYFEEHKPVAWAQVFGGTFDRDAEGSALGYDHNHVGTNFGYEWDMSDHRVGLLGGVVRTSTDTQTTSFETEADNYYVGAYANRKSHGLNITGSLIVGYGDHENDRLVVDNLNGIENAESDFDSWFISPGVTVASAYSVADRLELRPSASVNYSIAWLDDYTESGTTNSNLSYDDRKAKALTARLQLAAAYQFNQASEFEFRVGMNSRHTDDDDTKVSIAGSQFKFANAGDENVTGGFAGATLRVADDNNLSLIADMEFGGDSDENYAAGSISLEYLF